MWNDLRNFVTEISEQYIDNNDEVRLLCRRIIDKMDDLENTQKQSITLNKTRIKGSIGESYLKGRMRLIKNLELLKERSESLYHIHTAQNVWLNVKNYLPHPYKERLTALVGGVMTKETHHKTYREFCSVVDECITFVKGNDIKIED